MRYPVSNESRAIDLFAKRGRMVINAAFHFCHCVRTWAKSPLFFFSQLAHRQGYFIEVLSGSRTMRIRQMKIPILESNVNENRKRTFTSNSRNLIDLQFFFSKTQSGEYNIVHKLKGKFYVACRMQKRHSSTHKQCRTCHGPLSNRAWALSLPPPASFLIQTWPP